MGMYDSICVKENSFNLPTGEYQSKDLDCGLTEFVIDKDILYIEFTGIAGFSINKSLPIETKGVFKSSDLNGAVNLYPLKSNKEYVLILKDGIIIDVVDYFDYEEIHGDPECNYETCIWKEYAGN